MFGEYSWLLTTAACLLLLLLLVRFVLLRPLLNAARAKANAALDVDGYNRGSDYSLPGFNPVHTELTHAAVRIDGTLPADLEGLYLRNGTNSPFDRTDSRRHMFNGAGMIHQVYISNGEASYSNHYIKTPRYLAEAAAGRELYIEFGDVAGGGKPALAKIALSAIEQRTGLAPAIDTLENSSVSTAIQFHHGKLYALQETSFPFELKVSEVSGKPLVDGEGQYRNFGGGLDHPFTAHPKIDPSNGDWYSYSTHTQSGKIHFDVLSNGQLTRHEELMAPKPAMGFLHDWYLTENYSVFPDLSLRFDGAKLMSDIGSAFYFDPDYKMRFGVIRRDHREGDKIQWFTTDQPGHIWHTINGWEERREDGGTDIVMFAPVFRDYASNVPIHSSQESPAYLYKYRLNLDSGEVTEQRCLLEHFYERPSYNTDYIGKPSRYAYLLDEGGANGIMGKGVLKYDLIDEKEVKYFDYGEYRGGEALFVARKNGSAEDDGYLVDLLMSEERACLLILDASSMEELARLHLPQRVPYGVHACWLGAEQLSSLR